MPVLVKNPIGNVHVELFTLYEVGDDQIAQNGFVEREAGRGKQFASFIEIELERKGKGAGGLK